MTIIGQFYDTTNGGLINTATLFSGNVVPMSGSTFRIQGYGHIYATITVDIKEE